MVLESVTQSVVGRYASSHCHMRDARFLYSHAELLHQNFHDGALKTGGKVVLVVFHKVGVFLNPVAQVIEERGLKSAEAVVEPLYVGLCKMESLGIALASQTVDDGTTGIAQSHYLRALVYCLAGSIVDGLSQHLHVVIGVYLDNLRVSSAYQKAEERERRLCVVVVALFYEVCHDVSLQMVHVDERNFERAGKTLGKADAHEQRAHEARSARKCHSRKLFLGNPRLFKRLVYHGHHVLLVCPRCQLGHHSAVCFVHRLACRYVTEQNSVTQYGSRRVVATAFYS